MDLVPILTTLAQRRPLFHSEADFQHALAWEIHRAWPACCMRLEYRPPIADGRIYVDIWASDAESVLAIELKYKTRKHRATWEGEAFDLLDQSAQDIGRYDFLKDVQRLERLAVPQAKRFTGYACLLTNDRGYWNTGRVGTVDASLRLHEGRTLTGELAWGAAAGAGTMRDREKPIILAGEHPCRWRDYSPGDGRPFKYLLVEVKPRAPAATPAVQAEPTHAS